MLRLNSDGLVSVEKFVQAAQHLMESYKFSPDLIINADESPTSTLHPIAPSSVGRVGASKHNEIDPDDDSIRTIIPFAAADGTLWMLTTFSPTSILTTIVIRNLYTSAVSSILNGATVTKIPSPTCSSQR
jgi:hypothetical protein